MASLITLSLPSLSSSTPTTMATSTSPVMINKPVLDWDEGDVVTFLKNNQQHYFLSDACIGFLVEQGFTGRGLLRIMEDSLVKSGMKLGHASTIMSLISELKLVTGVRGPRKWNSDSFSNYAYLLTILSSLKLLLPQLVSETWISFFKKPRPNTPPLGYSSVEEFKAPPTGK